MNLHKNTKYQWYSNTIERYKVKKWQNKKSM